MSSMPETSQPQPKPTRSARSRERALATASRLFYALGVRAVGMEQIVETSGVAKTTIYRHFPTKDALVEAFLEREDAEFWSQWEAAISAASDPHGRIVGLCAWIGERVQRPRYRGCPQVNVAAEFANETHPARAIARRHKTEMHRRLAILCVEAGCPEPDLTAMQIALLFDGAFVSGPRLAGFEAGALLAHAAGCLLRCSGDR
ncbi:MAG TPA: TetR/AcrR family transcriptional regulator [Caulobacteraceae bacterium]|nr:TetR/AcrR family transcriptional regulator [Caulobacteraceae bacterium]